MIAIIRARARIAAKIEPTMIGVVFLLVAELCEATVGDAIPGELVEVAPIDSTRLGSGRAAVIEPAKTVGWDGRDDAGTELEPIAGIGLEG